MYAPWLDWIDYITNLKENTNTPSRNRRAFDLSQEGQLKGGKGSETGTTSRVQPPALG